MNLKNKRNIKASLLTSTISLALLSISSTNASTTVTQEQCAGIVKAGMNDCASSEHTCVGLNSEDGYDSDWLWLPAGTCDKISGTHVIGSPKSMKKV